MERGRMNSIVIARCSTILTKIKRGALKEKNAPDVVVACSRYGDEHHCKVGQNGKATDVSYVPKMKEALSILGKIGQLSRFGDCNYPIGQCAEPHAANAILSEKRYRGTKVDALIFSNAYRPRTKHRVDCGKRIKIGNTIKREPYCNNCKRVFNL